jgi:hypothetical protein
VIPIYEIFRQLPSRGFSFIRFSSCYGHDATCKGLGPRKAGFGSKRNKTLDQTTGRRRGPFRRGDLRVKIGPSSIGAQPSHSGKFPESALFLQEASQVIAQQYGSKLQTASQQSISLQPGEPLDS